MTTCARFPIRTSGTADSDLCCQRITAESRRLGNAGPLLLLLADHPLRAAAAGLIHAVGDGRIAATTTVEVIQEFTHVRARRGSRSEAVALARDAVTLLTPLVTVTPEDLTAGLTLFDRHTGLGTFDAVLVAVARRIGATFVTADRGIVAAMTDDVVDLADPTATSWG
jgi:uncharacterized protein